MILLKKKHRGFELPTSLIANEIRIHIKYQGSTTSRESKRKGLYVTTIFVYSFRNKDYNTSIP